MSKKTGRTGFEREARDEASRYGSSKSPQGRDLPEGGLRYSPHALQRMAQRGISAEEVSFVVMYGSILRAAGVVHYFLRKKDIPETHRRDPWVHKLEGTTVVMGRKNKNLVLTTFRNRKAFRRIRRKPKTFMPGGKLSDQIMESGTGE